MSQSDYNKPRTNLVELLPDVYKSDTNTAVFENTFNRHLTKTELEHISGIIGTKHDAALIDRQIQEPSVHRQAFQLQPALYTKVATVDHLTTFKDVQSELSNIGVDVDRQDKWGDTERYNFAPPITFDKIINYTDYFWVNRTGESIAPQYITIASDCTTATARYNQKNTELQTFGADRPIFTIYDAANSFVVLEDVSEFFLPGSQFTVANSTGNDGVYTVDSASAELGKTAIKVVEPIPNRSTVSGAISFANALDVLKFNESVVCDGSPGWDIPEWDESPTLTLTDEAYLQSEGAAWRDGQIPSEGLNYWDYIARAKLVNPWVSENRWVHRLDLESGQFSSAQRAQAPIIEYTTEPELNEWNYAAHVWHYRKTTAHPWEPATREPTLEEIEDLTQFHDNWVLLSVNDPIPVDRQVLNGEVVSATNDLPAGSKTLTTTDNQTFSFKQSLSDRAVYGYNDIRVFVDGIQQIGTYTEVADLSGQYVGGIKFFTPQPDEAMITVELDAAAEVDVGREKCIVRTIADNTLFEEQGPEEVSLIRYRRAIQTKQPGELKYPLFDLFNTDGTTAHQVSSIFALAESSESAVMSVYNRRVYAPEGDITFEQKLIGEDGQMFAYRNYYTKELHTIWRHNPDKRYVPKIVDSERRGDGEGYFDEAGDYVYASVNQSNGDWEIPSQLYYNAEHENRSTVSASELITHFGTMLSNQDLPVGFTSNQQYAHRLMEPGEFDYGVGGTIREHNDSYDTMLSAMYVTNSNPLGVLTFASNEYDRGLNALKEYLRSRASEYMLDVSYDSITDFNSVVTKRVIESYVNNDNNSVIYGDSTSYDPINKIGVKNFIATLPILNMAHKVKPVALMDSKLGISEMRHHDNHISTVQLTDSTVNGIATSVINTVIDKDTGRRRGWKTDAAADHGVVKSSHLEIEWQRLSPGDYWMDNDGTLYRFTAIALSPLPPTGGVADGTLWVRDTDGMLFVRDETSDYDWEPVNGVAGDVSAAWKSFNLTTALSNVILDLETRLYEVSSDDVELKFSKDQYILDDGDQAVYDEMMYVAFLDYTRRQGIADPFASDYKISDPFTWNYTGIVETHSPTNAPVSEFWAPRWYDINQNIFGTPYPHLEPWVLQGYTDKPVWWDALYADDTGTRRWKSAMWNNVRFAVIPTHPDWVIEPPVGVIPTYQFVSVNTTSNTTTDGYAPDDLLPPYWVPASSAPEDIAVSNQSFIRTPLAALTGTQINRGYEFGDNGPIENKWRKSSRRLYDEMIAALRLQPVRFMHYTFGVEYNEIDGLRINKDTGKVYSHKDAVFHGDLRNNSIQQLNGICQWYINYNRSSSYDAKNSDFRTLWKDWEARLAYQFSGFIDTKSVKAETVAFNVLGSDRNIIVNRSPGFRSYWIDALKVSVAKFGKSQIYNSVKIPTNKGHDWTFIIDGPAQMTREVEYYDVRNHEFTIVDAVTGLLESSDPIHWVTGDEVTLYSTGSLPTSLVEVAPYYVVRASSSTQFYLAETHNESLLSNPIVITYEGDQDSGIHHVTELTSTFNTGSTSSDVSAAWRHHATIDTVNTTTFPITVVGIQGVIDFVDGYRERLTDQGFVFNHSDAREVDPATGRLVDWQLEIEYFIDKAYTGIGINNVPGSYIGQTYEFQVNDVTDSLFTPALPVPFDEGQEVYLFTSGTLPVPLIENTPYYIIPVSGNGKQFRLGKTAAAANQGIAIDVIGSGAGKFQIGTFSHPSYIARSHVELNPFRNNLWFSHPEGVVANVNRGPFSDIRTEQTVYDQYGRPINESYMNVYRSDTISRINIQEDVSNDIDNNANARDDIHIGGMHLFLDGYEHVIVFNNYTTSGYLVYDPFVGLNTARFAIAFDRQVGRTRRPNVGGHFFDGSNTTRNLEGSIEDMADYYDTHSSRETADYIPYTRELLGYDNPAYLDHLGASEKSKFVFWRGAIQHKGSINAITAFINSIQFVDAKVDEYWAYKIAEFGDSRERTAPRVQLSASDSLSGDIKLQVADTDDVVDDNFIPLTTDQDTRWLDLPNVTSIGDLNFKSSSVARIEHDTSVGSLVDLGQYCDVVSVISSDGGLIAPNNYDVIDGRLIDLSGVAGRVVIHVKNVSLKAHNPSRLVDSVNKVTVADLAVWDPIKGVHYWSALHNVDYIGTVDPSKAADVYSALWTNDYIGTTWLDETSLGYLPYHNRDRYARFEDQMKDWGKIAEWADLTVLEWVKSTVKPESYSTLVGTQEGDATIEPEQRASGTPVKFLFVQTADGWERADTKAELHLDFYKIQHTMDGSVGIPVWPSTDKMDVYINGKLKVADVDVSTASDQISAAGSDINTHIHFVRTIGANQFGDAVGQYKLDYDPIIVNRLSDNGVDYVQDYYFWVHDRAVASTRRTMSSRNVELELLNPGVPYQVIRQSDSLYDESIVSNSTLLADHERFAKFDQIIVRNVRYVVQADNRYILQLTRDFTMRDSHNNGADGSMLKNTHTEWGLFRKNQPSNIPQALWVRVTEAVVGYELDNLDNGKFTPVPSLDRILYDDMTDGTTRFGMSTGQAFCDGELALQTILAVINRVDFVPYPVNKFEFLRNSDFTTPQGRRVAMETIYNSFPNDHVNTLFFEVLQDALADKIEYPDIFKTSQISIHGIKVLETTGNVYGI